MKNVNLVTLFMALGYKDEKTAKSQKTIFLKKSLGYDEDEAKVLEVTPEVATAILEGFISNVKTGAQIARSDIAKTINLKDAKFYAPLAEKTPDDIVKALKAEIKTLKLELEETRKELELALADDVMDEDDEEETEEEDEE